jgi:Mor family transcriptional regulator
MATSADEDVVWDDTIGRHVDVFYLALMEAAGDTLLPELYDIFGKEVTIKFLERFEGTQITVPSGDILKAAARKAAIYAALVDADDKDAKASELAREHNMRPAQVLDVYTKAQEMAKVG